MSFLGKEAMPFVAKCVVLLAAVVEVLLSAVPSFVAFPFVLFASASVSLTFFFAALDGDVNGDRVPLCVAMTFCMGATSSTNKLSSMGALTVDAALAVGAAFSTGMFTTATVFGVAGIAVPSCIRSARVTRVISHVSSAMRLFSSIMQMRSSRLRAFRVLLFRSEDSVVAGCSLLDLCQKFLLVGWQS